MVGVNVSLANQEFPTTNALLPGRSNVNRESTRKSCCPPLFVFIILTNMANAVRIIPLKFESLCKYT